MRDPRRRTSLLGVVALLAGIAAITVSRLDLAELPVVGVGQIHLKLVQSIAAGGLLVALIGLLAAASSPRTNTLTPIIATLVCIAATALAFYPKLLTQLSRPSVKLVPAKPSQATEPSPRAPVTGTPSPQHIKTIFDSDYQSPTAPPSINTPQVKRTAPPPSAEASEQAVHRDVVGEIRAARAKRQAARAAIVRSLEPTPDYRAAKDEVDAAEANLNVARGEYPPASPELIAASQTLLEARTKLDHIVSAAVEKDPAAQEGDRELKAALSAGSR